MESENGDRMKRVVVDRFGGPEVVKVVDDQVPQPGAGEVRVRVLAAGVSYTDAMLRAGSYLGVPKPPFTPGYELVGVVEKLGPGCSRLQVGDRIGALRFGARTRSEYVFWRRMRSRCPKISTRRRSLTRCSFCFVRERSIRLWPSACR